MDRKARGTLLKEIVLRFLIGGAAVSAFAALGNLFKPKSLAGLFGAAPSVALATLLLTVFHDGKRFAASEARSMMAGAAAFFVYTAVVSWLLMRFKRPALAVTILAAPVWFGVAFGLCFLFSEAWQ